MKLYIREAGSPGVQELVASQAEPLPVWDFLQMESWRWVGNRNWTRRRRERLFRGEELERLRGALDAIEAAERGGADVGGNRRFGRLFLRHLMDKHADFLGLIRCQPLLAEDDDPELRELLGVGGYS